MKEKYCGKCNELKSVEYFHRRGKGYQSVCKSCRKSIDAELYKSHPQEVKDRIQSRKRERATINRINVANYLKSNPCVDCGEKDIIVLEFDHIRDKKYNVSEMINTSLSWKTIKNEIDKCEVRCANCHRRKTAIQQGWLVVSLAEVDNPS